MRSAATKMPQRCPGVTPSLHVGKVVITSVKSQAPAFTAHPQLLHDRMLLQLHQYLLETIPRHGHLACPCLLYTSDAADEEDSVDLGGRRIIKKKKRKLMYIRVTKDNIK
eukprot:TRINITY_DN29379_c0_g1_i2.p1 TRINITY_DN29379_c0_g1~~TRINITY_DN29379_c0_g1_i2.p1  ORF type:complete len:110 (-),score=12.20 TRINITY_DN29379_c0_g1_i2:58-387(-)